MNLLLSDCDQHAPPPSQQPADSHSLLHVYIYTPTITRLLTCSYTPYSPIKASPAHSLSSFCLFLVTSLLLPTCYYTIVTSCSSFSTTFHHTPPFQQLADSHALLHVYIYTPTITLLLTCSYTPTLQARSALLTPSHHPATSSSLSYSYPPVVTLLLFTMLLLLTYLSPHPSHSTPSYTLHCDD